MIYFSLQGHEHEHDVQTMIQVFYPNLRYIRQEEVPCKGLFVVSARTDSYIGAQLFFDGAEIGEKKISYRGELSDKEEKRLIKLTIYEVLKAKTGLRPQWGIHTGVRPAKIITTFLDEGKGREECLSLFEEEYLVMPHKAELAMKVALAERRILSQNAPEDISVYMGIPFCPTRCLYCSFTAYPLERYKNRVDEYLDALFKELEFLAEYSRPFNIKSLYIGGGTPTSLTEPQLERLLKRVAELFAADGAEYTLEAGRPDTITADKLRLMKEYGVSRISINPQTMNDETLKRIGRRHSVDDIKRVFYEAREIGHDNINMDIILGLPGETPADVKNTMEKIMALSPDNLTVHTLAVKRASRLKEEFDLRNLTTAQALEKMLKISGGYAQKMGMEPYYMYRQKNMVGNFENVGYCTPGKESTYNIQIMEEKQTILAAGAGASTKTVDLRTNRVERIFNVKSVEDYIDRIDEMIERKRKGLPKGDFI